MAFKHFIDECFGVDADIVLCLKDVDAIEYFEITLAFDGDR